MVHAVKKKEKKKVKQSKQINRICWSLQEESH